jgi:hypothetical protein
MSQAEELAATTEDPAGACGENEWVRLQAARRRGSRGRLRPRRRRPQGSGRGRGVEPSAVERPRGSGCGRQLAEEGARGGENENEREVRAMVATMVGGRLAVGVDVFSRLRWAAGLPAFLLGWPCHVPGVQPRHSLPTGLHARPKWLGFIPAHLHRPICSDIPVMDSLII